MMRCGQSERRTGEVTCGVFDAFEGCVDPLLACLVCDEQREWSGLAEHERAKWESAIALSSFANQQGGPPRVHVSR